MGIILPAYYDVSSVEELVENVGKLKNRQEGRFLFGHLLEVGDFFGLERHKSVLYFPGEDKTGEIIDLTGSTTINTDLLLFGDREIIQSGGRMYGPVFQCNPRRETLSLIYFLTAQPRKKSRLSEDLDGLKVYRQRIA